MVVVVVVAAAAAAAAAAVVVMVAAVAAAVVMGRGLRGVQKVFMQNLDRGLWCLEGVRRAL